MKIQIYGAGCAKCSKLTANAEEAIRETGVEAVVEKVEGIREIADAGVMFTPGLAIDGKMMAAGKVPKAEQIVGWIKSAQDST